MIGDTKFLARRSHRSPASSGDKPVMTWRTRYSESRELGRVAPYDCLARYYDDLVGDALFPAIRESFELYCRQTGMRFTSAADIGCGTGRFLSYLLRFGVPLIGVDRSRAVLREAAYRLRGGSVLLLNQDMRRLRLPYPVDLLTCNGDTLNYLINARELVIALKRMRAYLNDGGRIVGDILSGIPMRNIDQGRPRYVSAGSAFSLWRLKTWPGKRLTRVSVSFRDTAAWPSISLREVHWQRWYLWEELRDALERAGFCHCSAWTMPTKDDTQAHRGRWLKFAAQCDSRF